ncbi:MAG TPA: D-Ala-D-Ala carboxypeptidase family metallohydrolase [Gemmatimonadaceae bacterium]|nr:D-Ala-D-Ala carboxypeptidase family metallohydrolase [Gemmatimonadaceae bacterium]
MRDKEGASSTFEELWSTVAELALTVPQPSRSRWHHKGMSERTERIFNIVSSIVIILIAAGWSWSIAMTRASGNTGLNPATGIISRALTDSRSPSVAFLTDAALTLVDPLRGESGALRAAVQQPGATVSTATLPSGAVATYSAGAAAESTTVLAAPKRTGIWSVAIAVGSAIKPITNFSVISLKPAAAKQKGRIGLYYIGNWPTKGAKMSPRYAPPSGFIEVTRETQNTLLSDHFRLRDFLPHDQANVWPKYVVVDLKLIDKMELVLEDLESRGIPSKGVRVMSGFRTPQYNSGVGDTGGRASLSRHMYGDAADIFIDNDGNGSMDDLNKDGRVNIGDSRVILAAVNRVEAAHPSLIGGCGVYSGNSAHGPFTHIDTRGHPARW